ncbi:peptidoglycan D,D-transpeptidase FtsI family protein [Aliikangiella coralliicola]|uniref:Peptidoglycan D,D-transpeptidase FtsI n=1 Tax=Aliikangiella coralliicola TaxID=2592383 RepID=A0A545UK37_9GAMM|nr:penicillin-binding transpeptidase domain-containing protein [Aliikangiella coralliicola]TQV89830.1 peptidoglycan glycosyltransferase FtsI [Aliikangiella coralliicola]
MSQARKPNTVPLASGRFYVLVAVLSCGFLALLARAAYLQVDEAEILIGKADSRSVRDKNIITHRGVILDRNGVELAVSIPVKSVWMDVTEVMKKSPTLVEDDWNKLAVIAKKPPLAFKKWIVKRKGRQFAWIARHLDPKRASIVKTLDLPGVYLRDEFRRYYPSAEITAHLVGFTDVDDRGREGLEKAYDDVLIGKNGKEKVRLDLQRRVIEQKEIIEKAEKGQDLKLSIDNRIQALAYKALKTAVLKHRAKSGSLVMLDVDTGEVLALLSQPSYNPNRFDSRLPEFTRNSAFVDSFEPGSTAKPFTVASALEAGVVKPYSKINTKPGRIKINGHWVKDGKNHGVLDVSGVLQKSSNVGVTKLAHMMSDDEFLHAFYQVGFGGNTASGFPGESAGRFHIRDNWSDIEKATVSYGYGFSVTPVQLAQAYAVLGAHGIKRPLSLLKLDKVSQGEQVLSKRVSQQVIAMMETVVGEGGTGQKAKVDGFRIAGKTGTARKATRGGYGDEYTVFFAGIAPVTDPKIAMVIFVDEPKSEEYYGGQVAAPVFAKVASETLRLLNVKPDQFNGIAATTKRKGDNNG